MFLSENRETILVVEDGDLVRSHAKEIVSELGYRMLEASTGAAALCALDVNSGIDLLFSDIGLPGGMSGRELAQEALRRRPGLKVLLTTGYAYNGNGDATTGDSAIELIAKPFSCAVLGERLRRIFAMSKRKKRVLVVEDEALIRMVLVDYLETLGFHVEESSTAQEAMTHMNGALPVDVAIVDLGLPDRPGDQLVKEMRAVNPNLPLIIASGYGESAGKNRFSSDITFLCKPYDLDALKDAFAHCGLNA